MSKSLLNIIVFFVAFIVLYFIARNLINSHKVPSLDEVLYTSTSTTGSLGSSTDLLATSSGSYSTTSVENNQSAKRVAFDFPTTTLSTIKGNMNVYVALNDSDRTQGLSDVVSLPKNKGVLFVFDHSDIYGFWMKDMNFPLDIVWIDANKKIIAVNKDVLPNTYPNIFAPPSLVKYVLEVNAESADNLGLLIGSKITFSILE